MNTAGGACNRAPCAWLACSQAPPSRCVVHAGCCTCVRACVRTHAPKCHPCRTSNGRTCTHLQTRTCTVHLTCARVCRHKLYEACASVCVCTCPVPVCCVRSAAHLSKDVLSKLGACRMAQRVHPQPPRQFTAHVADFGNAVPLGEARHMCVGWGLMGCACCVTGG